MAINELFLSQVQTLRVLADERIETFRTGEALCVRLSCYQSDGWES